MSIAEDLDHVVMVNNLIDYLPTLPFPVQVAKLRQMNALFEKNGDTPAFDEEELTIIAQIGLKEYWDVLEK